MAIKVYNSKSEVNPEEFKKFCLDTYSLILSGFNNGPKWISISPTVYSLLAHGWELVALNSGIGLGEFTEGGLENDNKFLRFYRCHLARKTNQTANLQDCLLRLWLRSDPGIRNSAVKPSCRLCSEVGHHTVACPKKCSPDGSDSPSLDDYYLSLIM